MNTGSLDVVRGANNKPVATEALIAELSELGIEGQLLTGYPVMKSPDGTYAIDAIVISRRFGILCFDLVDGTDLQDYSERQDDMFNKVQSRLLTHKNLVRRRELCVSISVASYAPAIVRPPEDADNPVVNSESLTSWLSGIEPSESVSEDLYMQTISAIQSISSIRRARSPRVVADSESRGARLQALENSISTLDRRQSRAVVETVEGVQRIRGLAGSGKTIVLALKAAYLHGRYPEWRIAVTFQTRSLKAHLTRLINSFYIDQTGEEPNWSNLRVLNAWGASGAADRDGMYHEFCRTNDIDYLDFGSAQRKFGWERAFAGAVELALSEVDQPAPQYDAVLVDEAQDLPPSFLRLCYENLHEPKHLVYAYDELQNLTNTRVPPAEEMFGSKNGGPRVTFSRDYDSLDNRRDIILEKCYRNSRPILITAHGLGFGIYRKPPPGSNTGLVQMFDQPELWSDIGYTCRQGQLALGQRVTLARTADTSPQFLEDHSPIDDIIRFKSFENEFEQNKWVANQIKKNLRSEALCFEDIMVIHTDPMASRSKLSKVRQALLAKKIQSHHAGVDTRPDDFLKSASITCTGIHRAKGNEAAMVYIINGEDCFTGTTGLASIRNRLFTAITRSKAWVRVTGVGPKMEALISEYGRLKEANFELSFDYPTDAELKELTIVHRDMSDVQQEQLQQRQQSISNLVRDLRERRVFLQDFDSDDLETLRDLLREDPT